MLKHSSTYSRAAPWLLGLFTVVTTAAPSARAVPMTPAQATFRANTVLLTIDVQVTASKDATLREFGLEDFEVTVSGRKRPVSSAVRLHLDGASVVPNPPRPDRGSIDCIFGFHRKTDRPTAHYLLGIQPANTDRTATDVRVRAADPTFATEWLAWRLPIR